MPPLFLVFLAWTSILFFHHLGDRDLWSSHEGRAAENAYMMLAHGHWALPRQCDFRPEMQKPPLYYWLVAAFGWVRGGVDATAARLPAALSAFGTVLVLYLFCLRRGRPLAGILAAAFLASMVHFTWLARIARIDMPLTFAMTLTLLGFMEGYAPCSDGRRRWVWLLIAYVAVAAALLLKGPIGMVLPFAVIAGYFALQITRSQAPPGNAPHARLRLALLSLLWGVPLVVLLVLPWYWWVGARTGGGWYQSFFWYHNFERALGSGGLRSHPWWFYGPRIAIDMFPWSLFLPLIGLYVWRRRERPDAEARFGLLWLAVVTLLLSLAKFKRADYLLPAYPGAALFLGCGVERWWGRGRFFDTSLTRERRSFASASGSLWSITRERTSFASASGLWSGFAHRFLPGFAALFFAFYVGGWWAYEAYALPRDEPAREYQRFAAAIRQRAPRPEMVLFFRVEAHALAFHLGPPVNTILEWENVNAWAQKPGAHLIVTSPELAQAFPQHVGAGRAEIVLTNDDLAGRPHEQPLVLLRIVPTSCWP